MDFVKKIRTFENTKSSILSRYSKTSVMDVYGISRSELSHSAFLKWLFSNEATRKVALEKFLVCLSSCMDKCCNIELPSDEQEYLKSKNFSSTGTITANTERYVKTEDSQGRVDLEITADIEWKGYKRLLICVENKVDSREHGNQTSVYESYYTNAKKDDELILFVFLAPIPSWQIFSQERASICASKKFILLNYQTLYNEVLSQISSDDNQVNSIIIEYCHSLINFDADFNHQLLAMSKEEHETLTKFLNDNHKFFLYVADLLASAENDEAEAMQLTDIANKIRNVGRYGKFVIVDEFGNRGTAQSKRKILEEYLSLYFCDNFDKRMDVLNKEVRSKCVISAQEYLKGKTTDRYKEINAFGYYFKNEIGGEHWENLCKFIENNPVKGIHHIE